MPFLTSGFGVYDIALVSGLTMGAIGFSVGVWFAKKTLERKVEGLLDFGDDPDEVLDLSGVVEE